MSAAITSAMVVALIQHRYSERRNAAKLLARAAGVAVRTAENWISGVCAPQAAQFARLLAHDAELRAEFNGMLDRFANEAPNTAAFRARHSALAAEVDALGGRRVVARRPVVPAPGDVDPRTGRRWIATDTWSGWDRRQKPRGRGLGFPANEFFSDIGR